MSDDDQPDAGAKITSTQQRHLHALLRDHGITGDKAVHAYLDTWLAEQGLDPIESRADLPARIAAAIIRDLEDKAVLHAPGSLTRALVEIQKDLPVVGKTQTAEVAMRGGGTYSYSYATLGDVTDAAMPLLRAHNIAWVCVPRQSASGGYELVGTLLHVSGEKIEGALPLHGNDPQVIGGAMTYFRRYLLGSMLGIITDTDPDARATRGGAPATQSYDGPSTMELLAQIDADGQVLGLTYEEATAEFRERRKVTLEQMDALDPWEVRSFADHLHGRAEAARAEQTRAAAYVGPTTEELLAQLQATRERYAPDVSWEDFSAKYRQHRGGISVDDLPNEPAWAVSEWEASVANWVMTNTPTPGGDQPT